MQQITWRADDELVARVKISAQILRVSMNEYLTRIAQAATDPSLSSNEIEEIRARLRLAGLLSEFEGRDVVPPDDDAVAAARQRAGGGTALSELVRSNR